MTPERLRELIREGETLAVELKGEERKPFSDGDLVEAVVCLANRSGGDSGFLLVGVEDDGRITGARVRHQTGRTHPERVHALIANRTRPSLSTPVSLVDLDGKEVLVVEVPPSRTPIGTSCGRYVRRALKADGKPECVPFAFHEMQALQADRGQLDYTALTLSGARFEDLDPLEFERFRRRVRESGGRADASLSEVAALTQLPEGEARRRVQRLVERGFLEPHGTTKGRTYHMSAATYRRLGKKGAYVRQRGFEPIQQEQMIRQYVRTHGSISRAEAADLCQLSPPQAYRVIQRLVSKGLLEKTASRGKHVRYVFKSR